MGFIIYSHQSNRLTGSQGRGKREERTNEETTWAKILVRILLQDQWQDDNQILYHVCTWYLWLGRASTSTKSYKMPTHVTSKGKSHNIIFQLVRLVKRLGQVLHFYASCHLQFIISNVTCFTFKCYIRYINTRLC